MINDQISKTNVYLQNKVFFIIWTNDIHIVAENTGHPKKDSGILNGW